MPRPPFSGPIAALVLSAAFIAILPAEIESFAVPQPPAPSRAPSSGDAAPPQPGLASPATTGDQPITGVVTATEGSRVPIAIAPPDEGGSLASTREIQATIRADLEFTGYFDLLPEERSALVTKPAGGGLPPFQEWLSVGADSLAVLAVSESAQAKGGARLEATMKVWDTRSGQRIMGNIFAGETEYLRKVAHRISDEVVRSLTGQQGIATTWISYVSRTGPKTKEIYLMDYDGAHPRRLARTGSLCLSPAWSPDGQQLAYISFRGRQPGIEVIDLDARIRRLPTSGGDLNSAPDWSPDGRRVAYTSNRDGNSEIYVMDVASGQERRLTFNSAIDASPAWAPAGREIVFTSSRAGNPQIYIMDDSGGNVRRLTTNGDYNDSAAWSPRGDRIVYVSRLDGRFELFVHDLATGVASQLTRTGRNNENPRWSPDGRHLVFASDRTGDYQIWTMGADGSNPRRLTSGEASFTPDWSHPR